MFDDKATEYNKNLSAIASELFLRGGIINISLVFIAQCYLEVPETIKLNA